MAGDEYEVVEAAVDGAKLKNLESYRTQTGFFDRSQEQYLRSTIINT